jgi:hypothetical protein
VAVTGWILDWAGGAAVITGWWRAHAVCAAICLAASGVFNIYAQGQRIFD